ncbi:MAG: hypothetical protein IRZ16_21130 [Myxococcaceae bacterium]|nr:hypothetical protein [Myxococcaceae bacterium]
MRCPNCLEPVAPDDFQCAACELLLDPDAVEEVTEPSVVRAMLAPAMRRPSSEVPAFVPEPSEPKPAPPVGDDCSTRPTALFMPLAADQVVPTVIAGLELAGKLRDLDAYVASFVDGRKSVAQLARDTRLQEIEVHAVIRSLEARRIVSLRQVGAPARRVPPKLPVARTPRPVRPQPEIDDDRFTLPTPPKHAATGGEEERSARETSAGPRHSAVARPSAPPRAPSRRERPSFLVGTRTAEHMLASAGVVPPSEPTPPPRPRVPFEAPPTPAGPHTEASVLQRAIAHERNGDIARAIDVLQRGIARVRKPAPLYNKLALILVAQRRDHRRAEELLKKALALEPENAVYQQNLFKVAALSASQPHPGKKPVGFLARLRGRK